MDLTGHSLLGKYEVEALLGVGGMGSVWRARHALTGRKLAIKVLDESYLKNKQVVRRFSREARVASAIQHPGIVEVLDVDQTPEGVPFMVMEFLEGETLAARIERRGRLGQAELVRLGKMLLEALEAAHGQGVVHRDLKPENIYVVPAGRRGEVVKILDFGISQMREEGEHRLTMTGSVLGTPHYMSPEQAMGEIDVDHRADLYAAGVVLYECAVGDVPYDAPNYNKLLRIILDQDPPAPRARGAEISAGVETLILWAMEKDRERRIGSAREMLDWLLRADAGETPPHEPRRLDAPEPLRAPAPIRVGGPPSTDTPRPAGTLPHNPRVASTLGETPPEPRWAPTDPPPSSSSVEVDLGAADELADEETDWDVSPTLAQRADQAQLGRSSPPSGLHDLDLDFAPPPSEPSGPLELDEAALRPRSLRPGPASTPPPIGSASSSGAYPSIPPAASVPSSPGTYASSSAGQVSSPDAAPSSAGMRSVPPRLSHISGTTGPHDAAVAHEAAPATWRRWILFGVVGLTLFVGVVALVRFVVQPGVDDEALQGVVTAPPPPDTEREQPARPRWVSVQVMGLPPGARILLDGLPASSPFRVHAGGEHVLEITAPGYEDRRLEFEADRNLTLNARMRPAIGTVQPAP